MEVFHSRDQIPQGFGPSSVAIGNFDGVHRGHAAILKSMCDQAKKNGSVPTVLTFYPHPVEILRPNKKLERITTTAEKMAILESFGVQAVLLEKFDEQLAALSPEEFVTRYLVESLNAASVHVGFNFFFGKNRAGDTGTLAKLCEENNIVSGVVEPVELSGERVSSSLIRKTIQEGDVEKVTELVGRPFFLTGQVIRGKQLGNQIGFPTANVRYPADKTLPAHGVYVTETLWQKRRLPSVTNIGVRPTMGRDESEAVIEVHLLDFASKIYDETIEVRFLKRLRPEKRFDGVDALKKQIGIDVDEARRYFDSTQ